MQNKSKRQTTVETSLFFKQSKLRFQTKNFFVITKFLLLFEL
jgi:hypothetical protein